MRDSRVTILDRAFQPFERLVRFAANRIDLGDLVRVSFGMLAKDGLQRLVGQIEFAVQ